MMRYLLALTLLFGTAFAQAPELVLKDTQGAVHTLSDYRGKVVLLNFWATWCTPCKREMPIFVEADKRYRDQGLIVLAASLDDATTRMHVPRFAHAHHMTFPVLVDATVEMMKHFGLGDTVPSTVLLDEQGNIVDRIVGQAHKKALTSQIDELLTKKQSRP